jgi:tRNA (pseudouridine54-N1)-methyltransferase
MRRFVVVGQRASAGPEFSLSNLPASSGRLDVLLRCLRAALLFSHGVRRDTIVYLVLLGGYRAPRTLRVEGATVKFLRPDERSIAVLAQKALAAPGEGDGFVTVRPGIAVAEGGLDAVLADVRSATPYVLQEGALDLREAAIDPADVVFFLGDDGGFDEATRARLAALAPRAASAVGVGPVSLHADDAVAIVVNELDRRQPPAPAGEAGAPIVDRSP